MCSSNGVSRFIDVYQQRCFKSYRCVYQQMFSTSYRLYINNGVSRFIDVYFSNGFSSYRSVYKQWCFKSYKCAHVYQQLCFMSYSCDCQQCFFKSYRCV